jgi:hypothetical protein
MRGWANATVAALLNIKVTKKISHCFCMARFFLSKGGESVDNEKFTRAWYSRRDQGVKVKPLDSSNPACSDAT